MEFGVAVGVGIADVWGVEFGVAYGGNARFGRLSSRTSPSLGGGMRFSGDHTLVGVFHGTTGSLCGAVEARRNGVWR